MRLQIFSEVNFQCRFPWVQFRIKLKITGVQRTHKICYSDYMLTYDARLCREKLWSAPPVYTVRMLQNPTPALSAGTENKTLINSVLASLCTKLLYSANSPTWRASRKTKSQQTGV
jgi:hypothetical protein